MNCEKCKNRKATLFYVDDGGGRHALCAVCGEKQSKVLSFVPPSTNNAENEKQPYRPEPSLLSLTPRRALSVLVTDTRSTVICKGCGMNAEQLKKDGSPACPECYGAFAPFLFPTPIPLSRTEGARMPSARRARLEKQRILTEMRADLRKAVDNENYELAATLRDKIRDIEGGR